MGTRITVIVLAMMVAAIFGCGAVPRSNYYQLNPPSEAAPATAVADPLPLTLLVGQMRASHLYREDRLVYATGNEQMGTYDVHRWAEPPTEMIQELLWRSLRATNRYRTVLLLSSGARGDYLVRGNLYDFKEISGAMLLARVSLELEMRDIKTGDIVWTHSYSHDEPVNGRDVPAVVAALDQNVRRGVAECTGSLNEYLAVHAGH